MQQQNTVQKDYKSLHLETPTWIKNKTKTNAINKWKYVVNCYQI